MPSYFVQVTVNQKIYKTQVSNNGCVYVDDFKNAVRHRFSPLLNAYAVPELILLQPDGITRMDPGDEMSKLDLFKVGPWTPLLLIVDERPPSGSSKKQLVYKGMSTEASCRKFLDTIAKKLSVKYCFETAYKQPTMGDLLAAKDGAEGVSWHFRKNSLGQITNVPLPALLSRQEWDVLKSLNADTNRRIHDGKPPLNSNKKPFVIIPHSKYTKECAGVLKRIANTVEVTPNEDDLIVKDELELSGSLSSGSGSPGITIRIELL